MPPLPHPLATLLSILLSLTLLLSFYIYQSPTSLTFTTPHLQTTNGIPGLTFSLSQISTSPPALLVTLQNNHPETTYTLLKWATPLDASALDTGVFSITTADGKAVEQVVRRITRKMPPPPNQIVELAPGRNNPMLAAFSNLTEGGVPISHASRRDMKRTSLLKSAIGTRSILGVPN
ncbi:hypothetical protein Ptr902_07799 [Pyrenophora tritici-repentis]|nr:hypothetical protein Ptr902_07799 [Pyrenophora tritici-repentis]